MTNAAQHAAFFAHLVELVPAKYYLHTDSDHVNLKYMKKADARDAKATFKAQHKAAKRASLDPEKAQTTLDIQRQMASKSNAEETSERDLQDQVSPTSLRATGPSLQLSAGKAPSREELRERLQQKLEVMRSERKAKEEAKTADSAKQWRDKALTSGRAKLDQGKRQPDQAQPAEAPPQKKARKNETPGPQQDMPLSNVNFGEKKKMGKKLNKTQLLAKAEAKQGQKTTEESWNVAAARAAGEKVYDDAKLLRKSLKKESKLKAKKSKAWQERTAQQEEEMKARQDKRKSNIQARIQGNKDRKKERREKKLSRAGFEGRKTGFITPGKGQSHKQ